jgi:hypothetical protein
MLSICLITLGDPATLTGGYRHHRRMAELAGRNDARIVFASLPPRLPVLYGRQVLRTAEAADVVLVDSIVAAFLAPWIALRRPRRMAAVAHQPPGGIDHPPLRRWAQARLDRYLYHHCETVIVASALLPLTDRVGRHGPCDDAGVGRLYRSADLFVLPSRWETYGTAYAEAMDAGLPVIGWRSGNLPHLVDDGKQGILITLGDTRGLAGALRRLAEDEAERRRMGAAAARRALTLPTWEQSAEQFFAILGRRP